MAAVMDRAWRWATRRTERIGRHNPWLLAVETVRSAVGHRLTGHAAEMSFFAVITLVPSTVAVGAAVGLVERILGRGRADALEDVAVGAIRTLLGPGITDGVVAPFVLAQLAPAAGGVAAGGLLVAWWLSSRLFVATSHALDRAYEVPDRPTAWRRGLVALAFGLGGIATVAAALGLAVVGPLWSRIPVLAGILLGFIVCLYKFCPNVSNSWRSCVPGAVLAVLLSAVSTACFRALLATGFRGPTGATADDQAVAATGAAVAAVVATVLWTYFAAAALLLGAELNAQLAAHRGTLGKE